jgi:WhiB family redox-sensing transcriptional regulator
MVTQNRHRENGAFSPDPKVRAHVPQDVFLQNNKFLVGEKIDAPRGGACQGHDTSIFFPLHANGKYSKRQLVDRQNAIALCRSCGIRQKCLMYSLEYEPEGIWGGFPEQVRSLLATLWKIYNKRGWKVKASFRQYRNVVDYIVNPEDISFIRKVAHDNNLAQPPFDERAGLSAAARRRISQGVADPVS